MRIRFQRGAQLFYIALFAYGTVVHIVRLATDAYADLPAALSWFFTALVVLDPLAAVLLWFRPVRGAIFGSAVLLADAAANGYANFILDPVLGVTLGRVSVGVVAVLGVALAWLATRLPDRGPTGQWSRRDPTID